jgi:hypothetical protein
MPNAIRLIACALLLAGTAFAGFVNARAAAPLPPPMYQGAVFYEDPAGNHRVWLSTPTPWLPVCMNAVATATNVVWPSHYLGHWSCQQMPLPPIDFL